MGLDKPAVERYVDWLGGLLTGDLGDSAAGLRAGDELPIWDQIKGKLVELVSSSPRSSPLFMIPLSLVLGALAAWRAGRARPTTSISITSLA